MCESMFRAVWQRRADDEWSRRPGISKMRAAMSVITTVRPDQRAKFAISGRLDEARSAVKAAVREAKRTPRWADVTFRGFDRSVPRPKGVWPTIEQEIAEHLTRKWSMPVTVRMVQRCRAEMRALREATAPYV